MTCKDCVYSPICKVYADFGVTDVPYDENDVCKLFRSKIDLVEVVRCCDCRYSDVYGKNCFCEYDPIETKSVSPNGYCSSGERRSK